MSLNYDYDEAVMAIEETEREKAARLNRLRAWEIRRRFAVIDRDRVRPIAAIETGEATDADREMLESLEAEAQTLREELAGLEV